DQSLPTGTDHMTAFRYTWDRFLVNCRQTSPLGSGFRHPGRNITTDNFLTSVPLAEHLLEKGLTIVGTLRQNKPDIPPVMKASKSREVHSTG
ncbi:hypothetical protein KUCAC02_025155, partial [Chaenocephalus aceratus]